jgi:hypothetical protein
LDNNWRFLAFLTGIRVLVAETLSYILIDFDILVICSSYWNAPNVVYAGNGTDEEMVCEVGNGGEVSYTSAFVGDAISGPAPLSGSF